MRNATRIAGIGLLAGLAVSLAGTAPALARGPMGGFGAEGVRGLGGRGELIATPFAELDADASGLITEDELAAHAAARLAGLDTDADGRLGAGELAAAIAAGIEARGAAGPSDGRGARPETRAAAIAGRMIAARDGDGDGLLSAGELAPARGYGRLIDRFDTDDDNALSQAELDEARAALAARSAARDGHGRGGHGLFGGKRR